MLGKGFRGWWKLERGPRIEIGERMRGCVGSDEGIKYKPAEGLFLSLGGVGEKMARSKLVAGSFQGIDV